MAFPLLEATPSHGLNHPCCLLTLIIQILLLVTPITCNHITALDPASLASSLNQEWRTNLLLSLLMALTTDDSSTSQNFVRLLQL